MNISTHSIESTNESRRRNKDKDKDGNVSVQRFHVGGSAFTSTLEERGERGGMRGGRGAWRYSANNFHGVVN